MRMADPVAEYADKAVAPVADGDARTGNGGVELLGEGHLELLALLDSAWRDLDGGDPAPDHGLKLVSLRQISRGNHLHQRDAGDGGEGMRLARTDDEALLQVQRVCSSVLFLVAGDRRVRSRTHHRSQSRIRVNRTLDRWKLEEKTNLGSTAPETIVGLLTASFRIGK
jgi:hypothetical protein